MHSLIAACREAACRPPTSGGTGGSRPGLPNGANPEKYAKQLLGNEWPEEHSAAVKGVWDALYPTDPVIRVRAPESAVEGILAAGRLVTQRESGTSKGLLDPDFRDGVEERMFSAKDTDPIYGYITNAAGSLPTTWVNAYGPVSFELSPEAAARTTVTMGDSLYGLAAPVRMTDVPSASPERLHAATAHSVRRVIGDIVKNPAWGDMTTAARTSAEYIEAQIHGPVSMQDVTRVLVRGGYVKPATIEALRKALPHAEVVVVTDPNVEFSATSSAKYTGRMTLSTTAAVFACYSAACRPPTSGGTGGSGGSPKGSSAPAATAPRAGRSTAHFTASQRAELKSVGKTNSSKITVSRKTGKISANGKLLPKTYKHPVSSNSRGTGFTLMHPISGGGWTNKKFKTVGAMKSFIAREINAVVAEG